MEYSDVDLVLLHKAETGLYPEQVKKQEYIEWLENKVLTLLNEKDELRK